MVEAYRIHSLVRDVSTRLHRQKSPTRHRFVQRLAGGTIIVRRVRPATVTKEVLIKNLPEIQQAVEDGRLVVKTLIGEIVDLTTLSPKLTEKSVKPLPNPPLDSAEKDKTFEHGVGEEKPLFPDGGTPTTAPPPLTVSTPLTSDDKAIKTSGDPAKARASEKKQMRSALVEKPAEKPAEKDEKK